MKTPFRAGLLAALLIALLAVAACGAPAEPAAEAPAEDAAPAAAEETMAEPAGNPLESPVLWDRVASGELPPLEDRLPNEPFVVGPGVLLPEDHVDWQSGNFGGALRTLHFRPDWNPDTFVGMNEPLLSAPGLGVQGIRGNVLKDYEVSNNNQTFVFHMREGLKWSDGSLVTAEDARFVAEDIYGNENLTPNFPRRFRTRNDPTGTPMTFQMIDDYTFQVDFDAPYGGFLRALTIETWNGWTELVRPSAYLKQFHVDHLENGIEDLRDQLNEMNLTDEWNQVFTANDCVNWHVNQEKCMVGRSPVITPWQRVEAAEPGLLVFERNPYYYKVDVDGKQLPYIDKMVSKLVEDVEMVNTGILTGEADFMRESTGLVKIPLYVENGPAGGYRHQLLDMHVDSSSIWINQTYNAEADPLAAAYRDVVSNIEFRQAVSLAVNRDEMIETLYYGYATKPLDTVGADLSTRDLDRANALLDSIGLDGRDDEGFRTYPSGETFEMLIEHGAHAPDLEPAAELVGEYLGDVGIKALVKKLDPTLWGQRSNNNELQATVFWAHDQGWDNNWTGDTIARAGRAWHLYMTSAEENRDPTWEPPQWAKDAYALDIARWGSVSGGDEYNEFKEQGNAWHRANLPEITIVENVKYPLIVSLNMANVATEGFAIAQNFAMEQLYYLNPEENE